MLEMTKEYVVTADNRKRAVVIDIETFEKVEEILESFGLGRYMEEVEDEDVLSPESARQYYNNLNKD
jgi:PHD/YefM family antitoxin component YafN of YafNO toxin-antitoxin module